MRSIKQRRLIPYLFISPFLASFVIFFFVPACYSLILSLFRYPGYGKATYIGFSNYLNIFKYTRFWTALERTFFYWLFKFIPVMLISFLIALFIQSKLMNRMYRIYKPIIFLPQVSSTVASALVFQILFARRSGVINQILGLEIPYLENTVLMKWVVLIMMIWRAVGWYMVIFLSGLTTISPDIHEAATIDGANALQRTVFVTIPIMKPIFLVAFVMDAINTLKVFTEPAVLTGTVGRMADPNAETIINLVVVNLNSGNFGMACGYGWILFIIIFIITFLQLKLLGNEKEV